MSANKSSAVADEPIDVLFAVYPGFDLMDFAGPMEVLSHALHDPKDPTSKAFEVTIVGQEPQILSSNGTIICSQITYREAHERLEEFDVLMVPGGNTLEVIKKEWQPLGLITDFAELQKKDPARERTICSICTGSNLLANEGILSGLAATTHPDHLTTFENICKGAATRYLAELTDVMEGARYIVNNLRFDIDDEDQSPYTRRKSDAGVPKTARRGSVSRMESNSRRESIVRRAAMRLCGLRVITAGGVSAGVDAALYLVSALVDEKTAEEVARVMQWNWTKGVVVDGLDV